METNNKLEEYAKKQLLTSRITMVCAIILCLCFVIVTLAVVNMVPKVNTALEEISKVAEDIDGQMEEAEMLIKQLNEAVPALEAASNSITSVAESLEDEGLPKLYDTLASLKKLEELDLTSLNSAIKNLSDVIEPLAKFFNVFKK